MVALAVRTFGQTRPVCYSRPIIQLAYAAIESGNLYEAGVLLREAMRRFMVAECEAYGCLPTKKKHHTIIRMAKALLKTPGMDEGGYQWIIDIIDITNRLTHCQYVRESLIDTALGLLSLMLNHSPEIDSPEWHRGSV